MTLFIIGNGFDLNHGYKTSYKDFRTFLIKHKYEIGDFDLYEPFAAFTESEWNNFENQLADIDFTYWAADFSENLNPNMSDKDFNWCAQNNFNRIEEFNFLNKALPIRLNQAVENFIIDAIEYAKVTSKEYFKNLFKQNDVFINFNYSRTLEILYGIDYTKIEYIHGIAGKTIYENKKGFINYSRPSIIFGHGKITKTEKSLTGTDYNNNIFAPHNSLMYLNDNLVKIYQTKKFKKIILKIPQISNIEIIGHNLGEVDFPYFRELNKLINKNVNISYWIYDKNDEKSKLKLLKKLFPYHKIEIKYYPE